MESNLNRKESQQKFLIRNDSKDSPFPKNNYGTQSYQLKKQDLKYPIKAGQYLSDNYMNQDKYINDIKQTQLSLINTVSNNTQLSLKQLQTKLHLKNQSENMGLFSNSSRKIKNSRSSDRLLLSRKFPKNYDIVANKLTAAVNLVGIHKSEFFLKNNSFLNEGLEQSHFVKKFQNNYEQNLSEIDNDEEKKFNKNEPSAFNNLEGNNDGVVDEQKKFVRVGNLMPLTPNILRHFKLDGATYSSYYLNVEGQNFPLKIKIHGMYSYVDIAYSFEHKFPNYQNADKITSDTDMYVEHGPPDNKNCIYISLFARSTTKAHIGACFSKKKLEKVSSTGHYFYIPTIEETWKEVQNMVPDLEEETELLKEITKVPKERRNIHKILNYFKSKNPKKKNINETIELKDQSQNSDKDYIDQFNQSELSARGIEKVGAPIISENCPSVSTRIIVMKNHDENSKLDTEDKNDNLQIIPKKNTTFVTDHNGNQKSHRRCCNGEDSYLEKDKEFSQNKNINESFLKADEAYYKGQIKQSHRTLGRKTKNSVNSKSFTHLNKFSGQTDKLFNITMQTKNKQSFPNVYLNDDIGAMSEETRGLDKSDHNSFLVPPDLQYFDENNAKKNEELKTIFNQESLERQNKISTNKVVARNYLNYKSIILEERTRKNFMRAHNAKIIKKEEYIEKINKLNWMINSHCRKKQERKKSIDDVQQEMVNQVKARFWISLIYQVKLKGTIENLYELEYEKAIRLKLQSYYLQKFHLFLKKKLSIFKPIEDRKKSFTYTDNLVSSALTMFAYTIKRKTHTNNLNMLAKVFPEMARVYRLKLCFDKNDADRKNFCHRMKHNYRVSSYWFSEFTKSFDKEVMQLLAYEEFLKKKDAKSRI